MANDRIWMRCKSCEEIYYLAKWYPTAGFLARGYLQGLAPPSDISSYDDFAAWIESHSNCVPYGNSLPPGGGFEIINELEQLERYQPDRYRQVLARSRAETKKRREEALARR